MTSHTELSHSSLEKSDIVEFFWNFYEIFLNFFFWNFRLLDELLDVQFLVTISNSLYIFSLNGLTQALSCPNESERIISRWVTIFINDFPFSSRFIIWPNSLLDILRIWQTLSVQSSPMSPWSFSMRLDWATSRSFSIRRDNAHAISPNVSLNSLRLRSVSSSLLVRVSNAESSDYELFYRKAGNCGCTFSRFQMHP